MRIGRQATALAGAVLMLLALVILGCRPAPQVHEFVFTAFGTLVEVVISDTEPEAARAAADQLERDFQYLHATWHAWEPSALSRVNQLLQTGEWFSLAPSIRPLLLQAKPLAERSGQRFNPAIGKLSELWGFHSDTAPQGPPPRERDIRALVEPMPTLNDIEIDGLRIRGHSPALELDFGGFAKGLAIDLAVEELRKRGIGNAIVNAGGDLRAIGRRGDRPWRIGVRNPRGPGVLAAIELQPGESIFTSGDYERYFEWEGERFHHLLDPATGRPARGLVSVTVIHTDAATADAAATALFVAGPEGWLQTARDLGIRYAMVVDQRGRVRMNPAMAQRVTLQGEEWESEISEAL